MNKRGEKKLYGMAKMQMLVKSSHLAEAIQQELWVEWLSCLS
jgi:hypothetical protein